MHVHVWTYIHNNTFDTGHRCQTSGCGAVLVLDGNQKNNRPVCAAGDAGYVEYEGLNGKVKTGCMNTPEQQSLFCTIHKPRQMNADTASQGNHRVVEMILKKKTTRNTTFYEVRCVTLTHTCRHFSVIGIYCKT